MKTDAPEPPAADPVAPAAPSAWLLLVIALGSLGFVVSIALSEDWVLYKRDHSIAFRGLLLEVVRSLQDGRFPGWNAFRGGGEPLAAYPSAMLWSPVLAIFWLPGSFDLLYDAFVVAHFAVAAAGVGVLSRTLGLSTNASILAGMVYGLSGPLLSLNNLLPALHTAAFGPWALAFCLRLLQRASVWNFALASSSVAVHAVLTDPVYLASSALLFVGVMDGRAGLRRGSGALERLARTALAGAFGALLIALPILLTLDLLRDTPRGSGFAYSLLSHFSLRPLRAAELVLPGLAGSSTASWLADQPQITGHRLYLDSMYLGASAATLVVLGVFVRKARLWLLLGFVFLLLMLGHNGPLHELVVRAVPGLNMSRFPVKFSYGLAVAWSLATATTFDALQRRELPARTQQLGAMLGLGLLGISVLCVRRFGFERLSPDNSALPPEGVEFLITQAVSHALLFTGLAALLAFLASRSGSRWIPAGLALLIGADLALQGRPVLPAASAELYARPPLADVLLADEPNPVVYLVNEQKMPAAIEDPSEADHVRFGVERLDPAIGMSLGIQHVFDTDLSSNRSAEWSTLQRLSARASEAARLTLFGRLGITHILLDTSAEELPGLRWVGRAPTTGGGPIAAFRLERHRAAAEWVPAVQYVSSLEALETTLTSTRVSLDIAIIDARVEGATGVDLPRQSSLSRRPVPIKEARAGALTLEVNSPAPGLLFVAQNHLRGWHATVNGRAAPVLRVEGLRIGVPLEAGESRVRLHYEPTTWRTGLLLSGLGGAFMVVLLCLGLRRAWLTRR